MSLGDLVGGWGSDFYHWYSSSHWRQVVDDLDISSLGFLHESLHSYVVEVHLWCLMCGHNSLKNKVYFGGTLHDLSFGGLCKYVFVCYSSGSTKDLNRRGHVRWLFRMASRSLWVTPQSVYMSGAQSLRWVLRRRIKGGESRSIKEEKEGGEYWVEENKGGRKSSQGERREPHLRLSIDT